eukprot:1797164-Prymnesium_polylepis.1
MPSCGRRLAERLSLGPRVAVMKTESRPPSAKPVPAMRTRHARQFSEGSCRMRVGARHIREGARRTL